MSILTVMLIPLKSHVLSLFYRRSAKKAIDKFVRSNNYTGIDNLWVDTPNRIAILKMNVAFTLTHSILTKVERMVDDEINHANV